MFFLGGGAEMGAGHVLGGKRQQKGGSEGEKARKG